MTLDRSESKELFRKHSTFIKLSDGDEMRGIFKGRTYGRYVVWIEGRTEPYDPKKHAGIKDKSGKPVSPSKREACNFYHRDEDGSWSVKIFDASESFFDQWTDRLNDFENSDGKLWRIKRRGERRKTRYDMDPISDLTPEDQEAIAALEPHDLAVRFTPRDPDADNGDKDNADFPYGANEEG
jgi:hypothetical protein